MSGCDAGTYKKSGCLPEEVHKDPYEYRQYQIRGICLQWTKQKTHCHYKANTYTNGEWTCERHKEKVAGCHPLEGKYKESCNSTCSICLQTYSCIEEWCITTCEHVYHKECVLKWEQKSRGASGKFECPQCRQELRVYGKSMLEHIEYVLESE